VSKTKLQQRLTNQRRRASAVKPAIDMPTWVSRGNTFFWWADSSEGARYIQPLHNLTSRQFWRGTLHTVITQYQQHSY